MRDDLVPLFQRLSSLQLEARKTGGDAATSIQIATVSLALGQPDQALEYAAKIVADVSNAPVIVEEGVWICILALCLKAAVIEGEAEAGPGWIAPPKPKAAEFRSQAKLMLEELPNLDAEQAGLLRRITLGNSLKDVSELISGKAQVP